MLLRKIELRRHNEHDERRLDFRYSPRHGAYWNEAGDAPCGI